MYACLYQPAAPDGLLRGARFAAAGRRDVQPGPAAADGPPGHGLDALVAVAQEFSPRFERHRDRLVSIDVAGLDRLVGPPRVIGDELRRTAAAHGIHVHVAVAPVRAAALVLAVARPGVTVVEPGAERATLAPLSISVLEKTYGVPQSDASSLDALCRRWGVRTLGEFAALPAAELSARLGQHALAWQAIARGEDAAPLVPTLPEERFESSIDLDWPIEGVEPLSFVLTRLLEPLSVQLERRDRGTAILHLALRLVTRQVHARHLQLPSPIRDVRTLRTLLLLDLDSNPAPAAIDGVTITIDPTPGRVVQHTLFTRAQPTPEQLSTLVARLHALLGEDRIGAPATVDSHRPGAFVMKPFATAPDDANHRKGRNRRTRLSSRDTPVAAATTVHPVGSAGPREEPPAAGNRVVSALRRCRHPVPARVAIEQGRPVRLTTDRRGFAGGSVAAAAGPWRTSGDWWAGAADGLPCWNHDEWDVAVADGGVYRIFRDRESDAWFIDAIVD